MKQHMIDIENAADATRCNIRPMAVASRWGRVAACVTVAALALVEGPSCGTSSSGDAGPECAGPPITCCASCYNDVKRSSVCVDGGWVCAAGNVSESDCLGSCVKPFCSFLPKPFCASCADGATTPMVCNTDADTFECPAGSYYTLVDGGESACGADASTD